MIMHIASLYSHSFGWCIYSVSESDEANDVFE